MAINKVVNKSTKSHGAMRNVLEYVLRDEKITPAQVLEMCQLLAERFFPGHQYVISVHQDKEHLHGHIVVNSVSYIDGQKLHQTRHNLDCQKKFTNDLCLERGLTVAEKGHHFDGSLIEQVEITAWSKDKYNLLINESKKSLMDISRVDNNLIKKKSGAGYFLHRTFLFFKLTVFTLQ